MILSKNDKKIDAFIYIKNNDLIYQLSLICACKAHNKQVMDAQKMRKIKKAWLGPFFLYFVFGLLHIGSLAS